MTLLDLPLDLRRDSPAWSREGLTLLSGLPEWVSRCGLKDLDPLIRLTYVGQTFEGGISAKPDVEAHGAYAFCALACLCIIDDPQVIIPRYMLSVLRFPKNTDLLGW